MGLIMDSADCLVRPESWSCQSHLWFLDHPILSLVLFFVGMGVLSSMMGDR
jgi:hypothetical protein